MEYGESVLGLQILLPGSAKRIWYLIERFGSPVHAWQASETDLVLTGGFTPEGAREMLLRRRSINIQAELALLEKKGVAHICYNDTCYPSRLKTIFDPPPGLYVRGDLKDNDGNAVALVGARKATDYGMAVSSKLAAGLALSGVTVVSGMARGVDSAAHSGALSAGGRTIAVLGCGVDVAYPRQNARLAAEIADRGALVSEFPLGTTPLPWHFPVRNRIISGLARAVVVVEARARSGSLITADLALDQGRDVMAVPGPVDQQESCGCNRLIKEGARLVENVDDILDEMGLAVLNHNVAKEIVTALSPEEESVAGLLGAAPSTLDRLVEDSGLPAQKVLGILIFLELKGKARQLPGKLYVAGNRK